MIARQGFDDSAERVDSRATKRWSRLIGACLLLSGGIVFALRGMLYLGLCTGCMRLSGQEAPSALYTALEGIGLGLMVAGLLLLVLIYKAPILYNRLLTGVTRTLRSIVTAEGADQKPRLNWVVFGMLGASLLLTFALFRWRTVFFGRVEGPTEIFQELGYLVAALAMMAAAYLLRGISVRFARIIYALIGLVVLLIFLEEISWGQWLFGFETPAAISSRNQQQEFNFHNFYDVDQVDEVFAPLILVAIVMTLWQIYLKASGGLTTFGDLILPDIYVLVPLIFSFLLSAFLASSALRAAIEARGILDLRYPLEQEVQETFISLSTLIYGVGRLRTVRLFNQGKWATSPPPSEPALRIERRFALGVLQLGFAFALAILVAALGVVGMIGKDKVFPPKGVQVVSGCAVQPGAQCPGVDFGGLDLRGVDLSGANMPFANLRGADLNGADLSGANLNGADLSGADLSDASLVGTVFQGAELAGANLTHADLTSAVVTFANLDGATLDTQQFAGALQHFQGTTLPDGYRCDDQPCSGSALSW